MISLFLPAGIESKLPTGKKKNYIQLILPLHFLLKKYSIFLELVISMSKNIQLDIDLGNYTASQGIYN